jgi:DNA invertase Pin-like site-specific DNA recombinase
MALQSVSRFAGHRSLLETNGVAKVRAALYSRFSTDRQNESLIADQVRICTEYVERQGWALAERFEDHGISGAALGNRPGVLRLREDALARRFDVIVVTDLTRLSRSQGDLSKMIDRLTVKGIRVIGVQDGYDSARRGHKLQAGLSGIIGEAFREMVKDRTYAALESRAKAGRTRDASRRQVRAEALPASSGRLDGLWNPSDPPK